MKKVIMTSCISMSLLFGCTTTVSSVEELDFDSIVAYELERLPNGNIVEFGDKRKMYYMVKGDSKIKHVNNFNKCDFIHLDEGSSYLETEGNIEEGYTDCTFYINLNQ